MSHVTQQPSQTTTIRRLIEYLGEAPGPDAALEDLPAWMAAVPRFRDFAEANRDKIRKKLRGATTTDARLDVREELRMAALMLADRRFELTFEAYGAGRRGPDFTGAYRSGRPFNVEVTRRRPGPGQAVLEPSIVAKLRQLPPSTSNVLVVAVHGADGTPDPGPVMLELRARADRRDDAYFSRHGLEGAAAFHAGLLRLAVVVTWAESAGPGARVVAWANPGARIPLPGPTLRALLAALAAA
jgi:hypothetical protein